MNTNTITIDDVMSLDPCSEWPRSRVAGVFGDHASLSLQEILTNEDIPIADRIWLTFRPTVLAPSVRAAAINAIVTRAVRNHALPCGATKAWAERWLSGDDRTAAAAYAAREAARAAKAAAVAAAKAAVAAAWAAWADDAAAAAAPWAAARTAYAAREAACAEEYRLQIADVLDALGLDRGDD